MTARERAELRDTITRAKLVLAGGFPADRKRYRDWAGEKRRWRAKRGAWCVYCGDRIRDARGRYERGLTCVAHRDLPAVDPKYSRVAA